MSLGTPYIKSTIPSTSGGITSSLDGGAAQAAYGSSVEIASAPMAMMRGDQIVMAERDAPIVTDAALKTQLVAAKAPLTSIDLIFSDYSASDLIATLFGQFI